MIVAVETTRARARAGHALVALLVEEDSERCGSIRPQQPTS
jgi:hypothetical protein